MTTRWSVSVEAEGDRVLTHDEVLELADAVAPHSGIASGIGTTRYGAQVVVRAEHREDALQAGSRIVREAAARAGLPPYPFVRVEAISEEEDAAGAFAEPRIIDGGGA